MQSASSTDSYKKPKGDEVLFTVDNDSVKVKDFLYIYNKNNPDSASGLSVEDREKAIKDYLDLYINFKLKVMAAEEEGLDQTENFEKELARYRRQLAKPYLLENQVTEQLVQEAYQRLRQEVNAAHILIQVAENASPADTLSAYQKTDSLYRLAVQGVPFDKLARENSEDPSAKVNGGSLGYFTAMQMVYPFENVAYDTPVGKISKPVRSQFGYHIVKVNDKRPARGKVKVAHIMFRIEPNASTEDEGTALEKAKKIYEQLRQGANWNEMCERFSDDVSTKSSGGSLPFFGTGSMLGAFEEAAFSLQDAGDISEPVRSRFGWHIIKLEDKKEVAPLSELRPELERKIARSDRSEILQKDMIGKLKKSNNFRNDQQLVQNLIAGTSFSVNGIGKKGAAPDQVIFTLNDTAFTAQSFYQFLEENKNDVHKDVAAVYQDFVTKSIVNYEEAHLADKHDSFRLLLKEYHDGILLFEMMEKQVWNKAVQDSTGLANFFASNRDQYRWKERADATIYDAANETILNKLKKSLAGKKLPLDEASRQALEKDFNKESPLDLKIYTGIYEKGQSRNTASESAIDKISWAKGDKQLSYNGRNYLITIHKVLPPALKELDEVKGMVIADYQNYLEKQWISSLKQFHTINVHEDVVQQIIYGVPR